jgi:hypothetical protein
MTEFQGLEQALKAINANTSPRYKRLERLERWVEGKQYDGRPDWWTGGPQEAPLWERAPCVVYPVVDVAIRSNVDLVFGESRFPGFSSRPGEDEEDKQGGLNEADSTVVDRFFREYHKLAKFASHCRDAFAAAQGCGTTVAIHGHRNGVPFADLIPAKWGTPKLNGDGTTAALEIRYPYLDEVQLPDGKWAVKCKLYRRVIDATHDTTFLPADADVSGTEPNWQADPTRTVAHGLGFCPVVWYPFMRGCQPINIIDGKAIHALVTDEIQGHDIALSQKHRCTLLAEPQPYECGVEPGFNPTDSGHVASVPATEFGGRVGMDPTGQSTGSYRTGGGTSPARKKGPGWMWSYPDKDTKVDYLSFPADILSSMNEHCLDLLNKIEDALCVVLPKPAQFKFAAAVSGRALQMVRQRQYDRCDQYRDDLWNNFLLPSLNMQLRIASRAGKQLKVPGASNIAGILSRAASSTDGTASPANLPAA